MIRCRLGIHEWGYIEGWSNGWEPPEDWYGCRRCEKEYEPGPIERLYDWFFATRLGDWYLSREIRKDIEREERERNGKD